MIAGAQWGVIGCDQLADSGVDKHGVRRGVAGGRLHSVFGWVYAVGHPWVPTEGRLVAALLHAGPGAALSHATAAWWWQLIGGLPGRLEVATTGRARSLPEVIVHHPRQLNVAHHRRFPLTTVARTLLDYATEATYGQLRQALSEADFRGLLCLQAIYDEIGKGRPGSAQLRRALRRHDPRLARTRSGVERTFLRLCEAHGIPLPEVNARIGRMTVDAMWRAEGLVVEIDGYQGHRSPAQLARDRRRELHLRAAHLTVVRYSGEQLTDDAELVAGDLQATLARLRSAR